VVSLSVIFQAFFNLTASYLTKNFKETFKKVFGVFGADVYKHYFCTRFPREGALMRRLTC
jgi:hypothetical protein